MKNKSEEALEKRKTKVKEGFEIIEKNLPDIFDSERFKKYLAFCTSFHSYSLNNLLLIFFQKPTATYVAGFQKWKKLGRTVNKGEKGIFILVPITYTIETKKEDENGLPVIGPDGKEEKEKRRVATNHFKPAYVFDISQTSGDPVPDIAEMLEGNSEAAAKLLTAAEKCAPGHIEYKSVEQDISLAMGAYGYYSESLNIIVVRSDLPDDQKCKTLVHEIAHSRLHSKAAGRKVSKEQKEIEAESVAFAICNAYGLDTSEYSFEYIASWAEGKEAKELKEILKSILSATNEFLSDIENFYEESAEEEEYAEAG